MEYFVKFILKSSKTKKKLLTNFFDKITNGKIKPKKNVEDNIK